jgi:RHH-type proline utilization regulon transcriptional repressor/proline dehydrogenase/delta 1-pyrroline-5-carboxylate dehydrogenase
MEVFLAEYGLSTDEGVALMCLAEALLRVPDAETIDDLIEDKIAPSDWGASRAFLLAAGQRVDLGADADRQGARHDRSQGRPPALRGAIKRLGEPVIRTAVASGDEGMGSSSCSARPSRGRCKRGEAMEAKGYSYSYDMLGEAARPRRTRGDYFDAYAHAIGADRGRRGRR